MISPAMAGAAWALVFLLVVPLALLAHVAEVRVRIEFGGKGLLPATPARQELALLGVPPLHASVLEPDFHLVRGAERAGEKQRLVPTFPKEGVGQGRRLVVGGGKEALSFPTLPAPHPLM